MTAPGVLPGPCWVMLLLLAVTSEPFPSQKRPVRITDSVVVSPHGCLSTMVTRMAQKMSTLRLRAQEFLFCVEIDASQHWFMTQVFLFCLR